MGGIGSGRHWHWDAKSTTTDYRRLDVRRWARDGLLKANAAFGWQWSREGDVVGSIRVAVECEAVRLIYRSRDHGADWQDWNYRVWLDRTPCNLGGERVWFLCPARGCRRRVALLYGGEIFACRHCHNLAYPSQREHGFQRMQRRADTIRCKLGWEHGDDFGAKPKGMHWRTFNRLVAELDNFEGCSNSGFIEYFGQRFGNLPV